MENHSNPVKPAIPANDEDDDATQVGGDDRARLPHLSSNVVGQAKTGAQPVQCPTSLPLQDDTDLTVIGAGEGQPTATLGDQSGDSPAVRTEGPGSAMVLPPAEPSAGKGAHADRRSDDEPPTYRPGRFEVKGLLGKGGMAAVFAAHDPAFDHPVSIKFLLPRFDDDEEIRERFLNEARTARRLHHANIVVVHDVGQAAGVPYMVMELVEGVSLHQEMRRLRQTNQKMPLQQVLAIGMALARGLDFAWSRHGVVHRDVKPGNIMLNVDGAEIKITDFGIAEVRPGAVTSTNTTSGMPGTSSYMSPEQTRGDALDGRSDLFSAGIVMYEALAGVRPFKGDNHAQVEDKIRGETHKPLQQLRPQAPASLVRVIERCLEKNPADRFQSGAELLQALSRAQAEIEERQADGGNRRLPLQWLWAAGMGAMVALVLMITSNWISWRQGVLMDQQVDSYGALLVRGLAQQNASAMLDAMKAADDKIAESDNHWFDMQAVIEDVQRSLKVSNAILLVGKDNVVRVAAPAGSAQLGKPYVRVARDLQVKPLTADVTSLRFTAADGTGMVGYESRIIVGREVGLDVGQLVITYPAKALMEANRTTWILLLVQAGATILAVAAASYFWARQYIRPIRALRYAMVELGNGHSGTRLVEKRNDELGLVFDAFNAMATQLQKRVLPIKAYVTESDQPDKPVSPK